MFWACAQSGKNIGPVQLKWAREPLEMSLRQRSAVQVLELNARKLEAVWSWQISVEWSSKKKKKRKKKHLTPKCVNFSVADFVPAKSRASGAVEAGRWREVKSNREVSHHLILSLDSQLTVGPAGAVLTQSRGLLSQTSVIRCWGPLRRIGEKRHQDKNQCFGFWCFRSSCSRPSPTQSFDFFPFRPWEDLAWKIAYLRFFLLFVFPPPSLNLNIHLSCLRTLLCWCKLALPVCASSLTDRSIKKCQLSRNAKPKRLSCSSAASPLLVLHWWQACVCVCVSTSLL